MKSFRTSTPNPFPISLHSSTPYPLSPNPLTFCSLVPCPLSLLTSFFIALTMLFNTSPAQAQSGIVVQDAAATVRFGEAITFIATIQAPIPIQAISIVILDQPGGTARTEPVSLQADGRTEFQLDTRQVPIRPFANVQWNYQVTFSDGSTAQSQSFSVRYADDRFAWQTLESDSLRVHWYDGDAGFGQAALDTINAGLGSVSNLMAVDLAQPIDIYLYANAADLQLTLDRSGQAWIAGHVDPALGVAMVVVEPGAEQKITMEQRIPHELMHVMMYRAVGAGYRNIPAWLREGTAALAEIYPNPDFDRVLKDAANGGDMIPINDLCSSFPAAAGQAFLAYAESRSFASYLHETYGSSGLLKLAISYADGVDCKRGPELAFNVPLAALEAKWRSSVLGQNPLIPALHNIAPYLVLLCFVLIIPLVGIVTTIRKNRESK